MPITRGYLSYKGSFKAWDNNREKVIEQTSKCFICGEIMRHSNPYSEEGKKRTFMRTTHLDCMARHLKRKKMLANIEKRHKKFGKSAQNDFMIKRFIEIDLNNQRKKELDGIEENFP